MTDTDQLTPKPEQAGSPAVTGSDRPLMEYTARAAAWRLTEKKARMVLESGRPTQIVGLIIRDMDTGQTTIIDESAVRTLHPSQWLPVVHPDWQSDPSSATRHTKGSI